MIFTDPSLLVIGLALTGLVLVGLWSYGSRRRQLASFLGGRPALDRLSRSDLYRFGFRRTLLLGLAGVALAGAAADPHWSESPEPLAPIKRVIIAIDVSASMQATDASPSRLARASDAAQLVVDELEGHEVGLLLFAGRPYPLAPPTRDLNAIRFLLSGVAPTIASSYDPGTLMSGAIDEAMALFARSPDSVDVSLPAAPPPEQIIVFIGDGDSVEPDEALREAVGRAREAQITIHSIGVGTEDGAGMVMPRGTYQMGGPVLDANGAPGLSRLTESSLQLLSDESDGLYAHVEGAAAMDLLGSDLRAPTVPPDPDPADVPPPWANYDLTFVLGLVALALVLMESLLDVRLPRLTAVRAREAT